MPLIRDPETQTISDCIRDHVTEWGMHPFDINNGECADFAAAICIHFPEAQDLWGDCQEELFGENYMPEYHCYIVYEGRYYDAEEPEGVDKPTDLPFYVRQNRRMLDAKPR